MLLVAVFPTGRPDYAPALTPLQDWLGESVVQFIHFTGAGVFIGSAGGDLLLLRDP